MASVKPRLAEYQGKEPLAFVISHNLRRRHLDESQRGVVAAKLANIAPSHHARPNGPASVTQAKAAEMLNIGVRTLKRAKRVITDGVPQLQDMVESGEVSVKPAAKVAKPPAAEQMKAVVGVRLS